MQWSGVKSSLTRDRFPTKYKTNKPENPFQNYDVAKKHKEVLQDKKFTKS